MKIKFLVIIIAVALAVYVLSEQLQEALNVLVEANLLCMVVVLLGLVIYQLLNSSVWKDVLAAFGINVSRIEASRVWIESESMKWLPGGVWSYGSRVILAKQLGVNKRAAAVSMVWEIMLTNLCWALLAISVLFSPDLLSIFVGWLKAITTVTEYSWMVFAGINFIMVIVAYLMRSKMRAAFNKLIGVHQACWNISARALGKYLLLNVANVSLFYLICKAVPGADISWLHAVAIASLSWLVGFWAIGVPGGMGVREAFMVILLTEFMMVETAIAVAISWRIIQMLSEIIGVVLVILSRSVTHYSRKGNYETV